MANCSMGVLQLFAMCFSWSSASPWEEGGQSEVFTQLLQPPPTLLVQGLGGSGVLLPLNWIWDSSNLPPLTKGTWKPRLAHSFFLTPGLQPELSYPGPWLSSALSSQGWRAFLTVSVHGSRATALSLGGNGNGWIIGGLTEWFWSCLRISHHSNSHLSRLLLRTPYGGSCVGLTLPGPES